VDGAGAGAGGPRPPRGDVVAGRIGAGELEDKLDRLPARPGVYLYKDGKGQIIYVGKAASLKSRVRSYFQESRAPDPKTDALVGQVRDLEYIVTGNELEASSWSRTSSRSTGLVQHHPARRQALPVPQAHHQRGVPAAGRGATRAEGRRAYFGAVLSRHGHARDTPARPPALSPPDLPDQDRRQAIATVPASTTSIAATRPARGGRAGKATRGRWPTSSASSRGRTTASPRS